MIRNLCMATCAIFADATWCKVSKLALFSSVLRMRLSRPLFLQQQHLKNNSTPRCQVQLLQTPSNHHREATCLTGRTLSKMTKAARIDQHPLCHTSPRLCLYNRWYAVYRARRARVAHLQLVNEATPALVLLPRTPLFALCAASAGAPHSICGAGGLIRTNFARKLPRPPMSNHPLPAQLLYMAQGLCKAHPPAVTHKASIQYT
mmetsp:Transcript_742/g.1754  ORF Transcript_742/g.1754 Transcript_742/m.1754 type:complete len:204 (-) Transcript_742:1922-2533(-)